MLPPIRFIHKGLRACPYRHPQEMVSETNCNPRFTPLICIFYYFFLCINTYIELIQIHTHFIHMFNFNSYIFVCHIRNYTLHTAFVCLC